MEGFRTVNGSSKDPPFHIDRVGGAAIKHIDGSTATLRVEINPNEDHFSLSYSLIPVRGLLIDAGKVRFFRRQQIVRRDADGLQHVSIQGRIGLQHAIEHWKLNAHVLELRLLWALDAAAPKQRTQHLAGSMGAVRECESQ
jgi:hypothetical protein